MRIQSDNPNGSQSATTDRWGALSSRLSPATGLRRGEPLAPHTTLRVGGAAEVWVEPAAEVDLREVLRFCAENAIAFLVLGRGSNLLVRDGGIRGVVISLAHPAFSRVEVDGAVLRCGAGARLKTVAVEARRHGLGGMEFLEGIPGSMGGALRMNAGAMRSSVFDLVETVRFMDHRGEVSEQASGLIPSEYRGCPFFRNHIALGATLRGRPEPVETIRERMEAYSKRRWETQPSQPSAGCVFKNPDGISAGKLVDELGLKGTRVGGALVSDVHANFIVNDGTATAGDVLALIEVVRQRAFEARGVRLETEVQIVGEDPPAV